MSLDQLILLQLDIYAIYRSVDIPHVSEPTDMTSTSFWDLYTNSPYIFGAYLVLEHTRGSPITELVIICLHRAI